MQLNFVGKNIEVTDALKEFTTKKFKSLEKRYNHITNIHVVFRVEHKTQTAEAVLRLNGTEIHATSNGDDMYTAIEGLVKKLLGQITKHKEKMIPQHSE